MAKARSYTDELAEWVKKRDKTRTRQDKNVVAFLAVRDDVKEAIAAGYAIKTIWEHMHEQGKIAYRYETFLKHVKRHIREAKTDKQPVLAAKNEADASAANKQPDNKPATAAPKAKGSEAKENEKPQLPGTGGFNYQAKPNKEDLI